MSLVPPAPEPVPTTTTTGISWSVALIGFAAILSGLGNAGEHLRRGDVTVTDYQEALASVAAGCGILSPGLVKLKAGLFARTPPPPPT